jgi:hypothetical protein
MEHKFTFFLVRHNTMPCDVDIFKCNPFQKPNQFNYLLTTTRLFSTSSSDRNCKQ